MPALTRHDAGSAGAWLHDGAGFTLDRADGAGREPVGAWAEGDLGYRTVAGVLGDLLAPASHATTAESLRRKGNRHTNARRNNVRGCL